MLPAQTGAGGTYTVGDEVVNKATGGAVRNVAPQLAGAEAAKARGEVTGKAEAAAPNDIAAADIALDLVNQLRTDLIAANIIKRSA